MPSCAVASKVKTISLHKGRTLYALFTLRNESYIWPMNLKNLQAFQVASFTV